MGCYNSTVVNAPIDDVWKLIRNFHDLSWGEPVITKLEVIGDVPGNQVGAKRLLNDLFHETLSILDPAYYTSTTRLSPATADNTTFVEMSATYASDRPQSVEELGNPIYEALLQVMKLRFTDQPNDRLKFTHTTRSADQSGCLSPSCLRVFAMK